MSVLEARIFRVIAFLLDQLHGWGKIRHAFKCKVFLIRVKT